MATLQRSHELRLNVSSKIFMFSSESHSHAQLSNKIMRIPFSYSFKLIQFRNGFHQLRIISCALVTIFQRTRASALVDILLNV